MSKRRRVRIQIQGVVQGVGFRPFVYRLARELSLAGYVRNDGDGVHIEVEGPSAQVRAFLHRLPREKPPPAILYTLETQDLRPRGDREFRIIQSQRSGPPRVWILPDLATCEACRREVLNPQDRRYRYPFINCTHCGPRFTIIESLPYDRPRTTMKVFPMCPDCAKEYHDPDDRRFHAQPNACPVCGPQLFWVKRDGERTAEGEDALQIALQHIREGRVVAVKGLGGFHLMVDAPDEEGSPRADLVQTVCQVCAGCGSHRRRGEIMTIRARREALEEKWEDPPYDRYPHAGLWLDRFLPYQPKKDMAGSEGGNVYAAHFRRSANIRVCPAYQKFYKRWEQTLSRTGAVTAKARTLGRLVVGLGADSVLENAIALHHTYGVPVIPGSALKGLAAHYAHHRLEDPEWRKDGRAHRILFGDPGSAGYVTFFDALYVPGSAPDHRPLILDVLTVHHPDYYRGEDAPPADWDSPNPVPFVSVRGTFLVALHGPDAWVRAALEILRLALEEEGIGAKTNSGYGRMKLELPSGSDRKASSSAEHPAVEQFRTRLDRMADKDV
ncbi:MAG: type III-B CRISPR module RAMP protein Cmr6, partial [Candidatus Hydrothermae bacterium]|nr:type III-B CRISPR module RAMP protein Cmr6 [Candidatus Hydrothermae bacterium]